MPLAGALRCGRPALVGATLPRRLYLLRLTRPPASGVLAVRPAAQADRSAGKNLRPRPALRSRRPDARHERLLGQRHAGRSRPLLHCIRPPSSAAAPITSKSPGRSVLKIRPGCRARWRPAAAGRCAAGFRAFVSLPARAGDLVLFESWLRTKFPRASPASASRLLQLRWTRKDER